MGILVFLIWIVAGGKQQLRGVSRKQLILKCRKDRLLTTSKPLKNTNEEFLRNCRTTASRVKYAKFQEKNKITRGSEFATKGSFTKSLCEKCPKTEYLSVFSPNTGKYGPEKTLN